MTLLKFSGCEELLTFDLSKFDTSNVNDMSSMFHFCKKLTNIDISNFKITGTNMTSMFKKCESLETIKFPENSQIICTDFSFIFEE